MSELEIKGIVNSAKGKVFEFLWGEIKYTIIITRWMGKTWGVLLTEEEQIGHSFLLGHHQVRLENLLQELGIDRQQASELVDKIETLWEEVPSKELRIDHLSTWEKAKL